MKRKFFAFVLSAWCFLVLPAKAAFVEGLEDIPLLDGLSQIDNGSLSFGNEEIRLVESYMTSKTLSFDEVVVFYNNTLPQLGWNKKHDNNKNILFERDGETLEISKETENPLVIRLTVKSKIQ